MEQPPLCCTAGGAFFGSSVFGPSVLPSFGPSVLPSFRPSVLRSFRSSALPSLRCCRCLIIASCSYQWTSSVASECGIYFIAEAHLQDNSTSLTLIVIITTTPPQKHLSTAKTRTSTRQMKRSRTTKMLKKSGEVRRRSGVLGGLEEEVGLIVAFGLLVIIHAC